MLISSQRGSSHFVVIPLRQIRNVATKLQVNVYNESVLMQDVGKPKLLNSAKIAASKVGRVYSRTIYVPQFSMLTLAPETGATETGEKLAISEETGSKTIRMELQLARDGQQSIEVSSKEAKVSWATVLF